MKTHWHRGCEFYGHFSSYTFDKKKVTCSRCKNKYRLERPKIKAYIVKRGNYFNVLEAEFIAPGEATYGKVLI